MNTLVAADIQNDPGDLSAEANQSQLENPRKLPRKLFRKCRKRPRKGNRCRTVVGFKLRGSSAEAPARFSLRGGFGPGAVIKDFVKMTAEGKSPQFSSSAEAPRKHLKIINVLFQNHRGREIGAVLPDPRKLRGSFRGSFLADDRFERGGFACGHVRT